MCMERLCTLALAICISVTACTPGPDNGTAAEAQVANPCAAADQAQHAKGTVELWEGTVRQIYIGKPLVGAKGYFVSNLTAGEARAEVWNFPQRDLGYEVFLFEIDVPEYVGLLFKDANPNMGLNDPAPPFDQVAPLIKQWKSLGTINVDEAGHGTLSYDSGEDLYAQGLNMIMVFGKMSEGSHEGPEDLGELMVECNGPIIGAQGIAPMELRVLEGAITVRPAG
ncbi:MAG: hypothetical protein ABFS14_12560 [Gemmatimonadota bacterium]